MAVYTRTSDETNGENDDMEPRERIMFTRQADRDIGDTMEVR